MIGLGLSPLGTSPLGFGVADQAPVPQRQTSPFARVAPRLDPLTGLLVTDSGGQHLLANGKEQRILIAVATKLGSSVVTWLGSTLHTIDRITDNHQKRVETAIRDALKHMTAKREIVIEAVTVERVGPTGTFVRLKWRDPADPNGTILTTDLS